MNKQEAIEILDGERYAFPTDAKREYNKALNTAIEIINQIDEPEKPVVPQAVADWIEVCKEHLTTSLYTAMNPNFMKENSQSFDLILWIKKTSNQDLFARAWLDGYEVEEEKLYTARLKVVTIKAAGYLNRHNKNGSITIDTSYTAGGQYQVYFTRSELEELNVWDNPAFEIEEVE
jgi:hypothetical protein